MVRQIRPPLPAEVELASDRGGLGAVAGIGHVIEFAETGVAGAGIVQGPLLSVASASDLSSNTIRHSGARIDSIEPRVADMIPPPISTTSAYMGCAWDARGFCSYPSRSADAIRSVQ